jgi:chloramphenicol-sensitive protein RarD
MKIKNFGYFLLVLYLVLAGSTYVAYSFASGSNPVALALYIAVVGIIGSSAFMLYKGAQGNVYGYFKNPKSLLSFLMVGAVYGMLTVVFAYVTHYISASLLAILYRTWPLMLIPLMPLLLHERITKYDVVAIFVGFSGLAFATLSSGPVSLSQAVLPFAALVLLVAFLDALATVVQKRYHYELSSTAFMYNLFSLVVLVPLFVYFGGGGFALAAGTLGVVLFLGIVQNFGLTLIFATAVRTVKTSYVALAAVAIPFVTIVFDYAILGVALQPVYFLIAVTVAGSLLIQRFAPQTVNYIARNKKAASGSTAPTIYDVTSAFINTKSDLIYNNMKGEGRVLAFCKKPSGREMVGPYVDAAQAQSGDGCIIFTNKRSSEHIGSGELEFIKEIMGHDDEDVLVLGVGKPEDVEERLAALNSDLLGLEGAHTMAKPSDTS